MSLNTIISDYMQHWTQKLKKQRTFNCSACSKPSYALRSAVCSCVPSYELSSLHIDWPTHTSSSHNYQNINELFGKHTNIANDNKNEALNFEFLNGPKCLLVLLLLLLFTFWSQLTFGSCLWRYEFSELCFFCLLAPPYSWQRFIFFFIFIFILGNICLQISMRLRNKMINFLSLERRRYSSLPIAMTLNLVG